MAEQFQRSKLYEYGANSNLVLEADRSEGGARRRDEDGKGEVETLYGKLDTIKMGEFVNRDRQIQLNEKLEKIKLKRERMELDEDNLMSKKNKTPHGNSNVHLGSNGGGNNLFLSSKSGGLLSVTDDLEAINYRPKTRESRQAYEEILSMVQVSLGDQPQDILRGAAEEVLAILKDEMLRDPEKIKEIEKLLSKSKLTTDKINKLFMLAKRINDFQLGAAAADDLETNKMDEEMGVAVVFDDDDENDNDDDNIVDYNDDNDTDDDEDGDLVEATGSGGLLKGQDDDEEDEDGVNRDGVENIDVHTIDAHWLQRQLSKYYNDANVSSKLEDEILAILLHSIQSNDERVCENKLVLLLEFDKFDLIKLLIKNRYKLYYCIKLKQSQNNDEKSKIELEMINDASGNGSLILSKLHQKQSAESWTKDKLGEMTNRVRKEAKNLNNIIGDGFAKQSTAAAGGGGADNAGVSSGTSGRGQSGAAAAKQNGKDQLLEGFDESVVSSVSNGATTSATASGSMPSALLTGKEKMLDLEGLSFSQGGHFNSNSRCELPEKSWRAQKKGYEEVHVPAVRPIIPASERLVDIADLPEWCQPAFGSIRSLNRIQSKTVKTALYSADNMLLCAPTSAGKTNVALMCMLNIIGQHRNVQDGSIDLNAFKIVYIAPMKALVQECVQSFSKRLAPYNITVKELSGDQNLTRKQIEETQVIVTTPEKWDIITRKAGDRTYTQLVRLIIIDEIHLLHDDRGAVLEALVARIIKSIETTSENIRLVGLSATLPNFEDVATFLRVNPEKGLYYFDNSFRPVPLQQQYIGVTERKALKRFQLMNEICYEKVLQHAGRNQILIFTHSRAETAKTAKALRDLAIENDTLSLFVPDGSASKEILKEETETVKSLDLKELLPHGFAIHHAGMGRADRTLVEDLFSDKHVQVLVSTATLAWGVNLPCHTVIIKGTQMYSPEQSRWVELSPLDIMQMMGRAGRYGLDSEGEGIIITQHTELQFYLSLMNQQLPIESQLVKKLPDCLNAEVVLGTINNIRDAVDWLGYTYLYVRMIRNPSVYGIPVDEMERDPTLYNFRHNLVHTAATLLDKSNLIKYDRKSGNLQYTTLGRVASHYYVAHETISTFNEYLKPSMNEIEIFRLFSLSGEFKHIFVREEEKIELAKLVARVPIPIKEGVEEPSAKVNVLLQAYISRLKLEGYALASDMTFIQQSACRIFRSLFEIAIKKQWAVLATKILTICKLVERRIWLSQSPLRQFSSIPEVIVRKLEKNSDIPWERYYDLKPQDLGEMVKIPKMGKSLYKYVHMFPKLILNANIHPITRSLLKVDLTISPDFEMDVTVHEATGILFWIMMTDLDDEKILHYEPFMMKLVGSGSSAFEYHINFTVPLSEPLPPQYFIKVISDRWLHSESVLPVSFRHIILPNKFPPPTELLDMRPLPISALGKRISESLYRQYQYTHSRENSVVKGQKNQVSIEYFNAIQTQTFSALYEHDDSVLLCAPTGSGKTICAEFAILRMLQQDPQGKCVYLAPKEQIAHAMYQHWTQRFGENLDVAVVLLTGGATVDLKLIESAQVIVTTCVHYDALSRRWKQRKPLQNIQLYIADELHLLGSADGPIYEVVLSRIRYIGSQIEKKIRIIGLSSSLANAKDVGDWLGVTGSNVFNFNTTNRSIPVDIHLFSYETSHPPTRLLSMAKPVYNAIISNSPPAATLISSATSAEGSGTNHAPPVIIYVPSRKQAQLTAIDMITFSASAGYPNRFLNMSSAGMSETIAPRVRDQTLAETVLHGVAYYHSGLTAGDQALVETLFQSNLISVLVCTYETCWSVPAPASLVVVMDTVYYEGKQRSYVDYSISDVLQMIGTASNPISAAQAQQERGQTSSTATTTAGHTRNKAVVFCQSSKRDYLRKLIYESLPIESHIDQSLHDHICADIVSRTIENKQDAVDYLTWTFFYRRIVQNPNYYHLQGVTHRHVSDHLSELIENVVSDLHESKCLSIEEDFDLSPLNIGTIASYYYIQYTTVELFSSSITEKTKIKGLLEVISAASEYQTIPIRVSEENILSKLSKHLPNALPEAMSGKYDDPSIKVLILLQLYFSRSYLPFDLVADLKVILHSSIKLIQSVVDVVSTQGWLRPALAAMELSQMVVQAQWNKDSVLMQLPHITTEIVSRCKTHKPSAVETIFDVMELDDDDREQIFQLPKEKMSDIAVFCNSYPNMEISYKLLDVARVNPDSSGSGSEEYQVMTEETVEVEIMVTRDVDEEEEEVDDDKVLGKVVCPRFLQVNSASAQSKMEGWWVVIGDRNNNTMMSIKRISVNKAYKSVTSFSAPKEPGDYTLVLYLISDSYMGCDQEYEFNLTVVPDDGEGRMDADEDEEEDK